MIVCSDIHVQDGPGPGADRTEKETERRYDGNERFGDEATGKGGISVVGNASSWWIGNA